MTQFLTDEEESHSEFFGKVILIWFGTSRQQSRNFMDDGKTFDGFPWKDKDSSVLKWYFRRKLAAGKEYESCLVEIVLYSKIWNSILDIFFRDRHIKHVDSCSLASSRINFKNKFVTTVLATWHWPITPSHISHKHVNFGFREWIFANGFVANNDLAKFLYSLAK